MTYGPDGKRVSLTDSSGTRKFFYDRDDVIQEYDSDWSTVTKQYTHGPWVDEPLSMTEHTTGQPNSTYYLMKDRLGSIINILDENETLKTTYSYDAFGEPTATYHSGQVDCAYRFAGREFDSGMGNYFNRARYYNQSLGRFFSRDPIMSLASLYAYCGNSPESFRDPTGMVASSSLGGGNIVTPFAMYAPGCWPTGPGGGGKPGSWDPPKCVSRNPNDDDDNDGTRNGDDTDWPGNGDDNGNGIANYQDEEWLTADDDGDGYDNGLELECNTDPDDYWDRPSFTYCGGAFEYTDKNGRTTQWSTSHPSGIAECRVKSEGGQWTASPGGYYDSNGNFTTFGNTPAADQHDDQPCPGVFGDIIYWLFKVIYVPSIP